MYAAKVIAVQLPGRPSPQKIKASEALAIAGQFAAKGQWRGVLMMADQVLKHLPRLGAAWLLRFNALDSLSNYPELERAADECLQYLPRFVPALLSKASALRMQQKPAEALPWVEKALALEPGNVQVLHHAGILKKELRDTEGALLSLNRCIAIDPLYVAPYWTRADIYRAVNDADIQLMQRALAQSTLADRDRATMHYVLAKAYEHLGDDDQQFEHIRMGAALKRATFAYDHQQSLDEAEQIRQVFFAREVAPLKRSGSASVPVFICGLPRGGSTLIEHILSSHPDVTAGEEIPALPQATAMTLDRFSVTAPFPLWAESLTDTQWKSLGERYQQLTAALHEQDFFTDKNLLNYKAIGVIKRALPEAKIVFCRRNPMDQVWGCYRQLFAHDDMPFSYSLEEMADTYLAAERLLAHWQSVFGKDIHVVNYEDLIDRQEQITRDLLNYVGLSWDDACLDFHLNPRAVRTLSQTQVGSKLTRQRIGQWEKFAPHLQSLKQRLGESD